MIMSTLKSGRSVAAAALLGSMAFADAAAQTVPPLPPRPVPGPSKPFVFPAIRIDTLPNGLRLVVVEQHELPLVAVRVAFAGTGPAGISYLDPVGKEGAWGLLTMSLREGTALRSATQINDEIADLGTTFLFPGAPFFAPPGFTAAKSTWRASLDLLADMLARPSIPAEAAKQAQGALATAIGTRLTNQQTAQRLLYGSLYGAGHPYTRFPTPASVQAITRDDLVQLQANALRPQNTLIVVTGDVTPAEARAAMMAAFSTWERTGTTIDLPSPTAPGQLSPTTVYLRDVPGLAQTVISVGQIMPGRDIPDAAAVDALVAMLGGAGVSSASRVFTAFRRERGLAYSPTVLLATRPVPETVPMVGSIDVAAVNTDTAVIEWLRVMREAKGDRPVTEAEISFARSNLVGVLPRQMETVEALADRVLGIVRDRLPPSYLNDRVRRINALTLTDVHSAARKYLDPDHQAIIVMGDRAKIEGPLRATGIPVVIVDR